MLGLLAARSVEPIEAALALAAGIAFRDHPIDQRHFAHRVEIGIAFRQRGRQAVAEQRHEIDADEIDQAEDARLGHAHRRSADLVGLLDGQPLIHRGVDRDGQPIGADAVGDEARRVVRAHDRLAHRAIGEIHHLVDERGVALRPANDLQQPHVARRVEEVGDEEVAPERVGAALDQLGQRDGRGIGRHRRARPLHRLDFRVERLLDVEPLDDGFHHPVALGDAAEMIVDIARLDQLRRALRHEGRGIGLEHLGHRALGDGVAIVALARHDIEQQHGHARVRHLRGDARAHRARADDADLPDRIARHHAFSSTVAMPWPPPMHWVASA